MKKLIAKIVATICTLTFALCLATGCSDKSQQPATYIASSDGLKGYTCYASNFNSWIKEQQEKGKGIDIYYIEFEYNNGNQYIFVLYKER